MVDDPPTDENVLRVTVDQKPDVNVRKPPRQDMWETPQGYTPIGEFQNDTAGELRFTTEALTEDSLIIVQAQKTHRATQDGATRDIVSAVQLEQAVAGYPHRRVERRRLGDFKLPLPQWAISN